MHLRGRLFRRLGAALSSVLLLQLTLPGGGMLCAMPSAQSAMAQTHDMSGMPAHKAAESNARAMRTSAADRPHAPPVSSHSDDGCRLPWTSGQCASMTACTTVPMPAAALVAALDTQQEISDLPMPGDIGSRAASPPELPPPRA